MKFKQAFTDKLALYLYREFTEEDINFSISAWITLVKAVLIVNGLDAQKAVAVIANICEEVGLGEIGGLRDIDLEGDKLKAYLKGAAQTIAEKFMQKYTED